MEREAGWTSRWATLAVAQGVASERPLSQNTPPPEGPPSKRLHPQKGLPPKGSTPRRAHLQKAPPTEGSTSKRLHPQKGTTLDLMLCCPLKFLVILFLNLCFVREVDGTTEHVREQRRRPTCMSMVSYLLVCIERSPCL